MALSLIKACIERGLPLFGICRGLQEMNVAFGGTLHPEIRDIPGRMNHRMPRLENGEIHPDPEVVFADRHEVRLATDGVFARMLGRDSIRVNSLHGQGILEPGERVVVEGIAEDGAIEAIRIADAPSFALGVQWHAEYDPQSNPINRALFQAFGKALVESKKAAYACRSWASRRASCSSWTASLGCACFVSSARCARCGEYGQERAWRPALRQEFSPTQLHQADARNDGGECRQHEAHRHPEGSLGNIGAGQSSRQAGGVGRKAGERRAEREAGLLHGRQR